MKTLLQFLNEHDACPPAYRWVENVPVDWSLGDIVAKCPDGDWLFWLAKKLEYSTEELERAIRPTLLREFRKVLRNIPDDVKWCELLGRQEIGRVDYKVYRAVDAAHAGHWWMALYWLRARVDADEMRAALPDLTQRLEAELCSMK